MELVLIIIVGIIAAVLFYVASRPDTFHVHRYALIKAPPEKIFPLVSDFHRWRDWSPWETLDADLQRDYSGSMAGEGAIYAWEGKKAGKGRMEIMRAEPPGEVKINLDFEKPVKAHNTVEFMFEPDGAQTRADWTMKGEHDFMGKLMSVFMNMDKMVGRDFEKGLAQLKAAAER